MASPANRPRHASPGGRPHHPRHGDHHAHALLPGVAHARGPSPLPMRTKLKSVHGHGSPRAGKAPGTPGTSETPPPAQTARRLTISGGFAVMDQRQRRLDHHARMLVEL